MSLIGYHCRKGMVAGMGYWYTLNYSNGYRADPAVYEGDIKMLSPRANDLSLLRNREIHIRKCWKQGNDTHFMTISIHREGRRIK